jgi:hypothetical protein
MRPCPSPLENLAAFAIAFFSGVISVLSLSRLMHRPPRDPFRSGKHDGGL